MLKAAREKRGLTQTELGRLVGMSQGYISKLERTDLVPQSPSLTQILSLAKELHVCPIDLSNYFLSNLLSCSKNCISISNFKYCNIFIIKHTF